MYLILFIAPGSRDLFICPCLGVSATFKNLLKLLCEMDHTMHVSKIMYCPLCMPLVLL